MSCALVRHVRRALRARGHGLHVRRARRVLRLRGLAQD